MDGMKMKITTTEVTETECCSARLIQAIETEFVREADGDQMVRVKQYWSLDGELLAETESRQERSPEARYKRAQKRLEAYERHMEAAKNND